MRISRLLTWAPEYGEERERIAQKHQIRLPSLDLDPTIYNIAVLTANLC